MGASRTAMQHVRLARAAHLRSDLDFLDARLSDPRSVLVPVWREQHFLRRGALLAPTLREAPELLERAGELVFLGTGDDDAAYFAVDVSAIAAPLALPVFAHDAHDARDAHAVELADVRLAMASLDAAQAELAFYARAVLGWHARSRYCGVCGEATKPRAGGHLRVCTRAGCDTEHFPRTDPCVLVLVTHGERCVLGRQAQWPPGMFSALAGFVEPGETLEDAVLREVAEETGLALDPSSLRYAGSQPWPFPASLMLGFRGCVAAGGSAELRVADDLQAARWVSRAELQAPRDFFTPPPGTLAGRLLAAFAAENASEPFR
jgi:NAD+ diphosphatase